LSRGGSDPPCTLIQFLLALQVCCVEVLLVAVLMIENIASIPYHFVVAAAVAVIAEETVVLAAVVALYQR
jgi:hypothetical protein